MWMLYLKLSGIASCCISVPDSLSVSWFSPCRHDGANHLRFQHSGLKSKQTLVRTFPFYTTIRKKIVYSSVHAHYHTWIWAVWGLQENTLPYFQVFNVLNRSDSVARYSWQVFKERERYETYKWLGGSIEGSSVWVIVLKNESER